MNDLVLIRGMHDTRVALVGWNREPWTVLRRWFGLSAVIALGLLASVYVVARFSTPDPTRFFLPGVHRSPETADLVHVLYRNSLVLALHAMACVAGFIAGSALPLSASKRSGLSRWVHEKAGPLAIAFVVGATAFSLATQAYALGGTAATVAAGLGVSPATLLILLLPHALPELVALFLPLAAWLIASRRGQWNELLAATFATVAIAAPLLALSSLIELYVTPELIRAATA